MLDPHRAGVVAAFRIGIDMLSAGAELQAILDAMTAVQTNQCHAISEGCMADFYRTWLDLDMQLCRMPGCMPVRYHVYERCFRPGVRYYSSLGW